MPDIHRLQLVHAADYRALMLQAYALHPDGFTSSVRERAQQPLDWWQARVREDAQAAEVVFGAFARDALCGVVGLSFDMRDKASHKASLFGMYVPASHRGLGLGRRLVDAAIAHTAQRPGTRVLQLTVTQGNTAALHLYTACGFAPFGVEPYAVRVGEHFVSKVHMWRDLRDPRA